VKETTPGPAPSSSSALCPRATLLKKKFWRKSRVLSYTSLVVVGMSESRQRREIEIEGREALIIKNYVNPYYNFAPKSPAQVFVISEFPPFASNTQ